MTDCRSSWSSPKAWRADVHWRRMATTTVLTGMSVWATWQPRVLAESSPGLEASASPPALPDFGGLLLQTVVSLALVCALAYAVLNFGLGRWLKAQQAQTQHLELLASLPLGPRRSVYLVKAVNKVLVIGASEAGLQGLGELDADALASLEGVREGAQEDTTSRDVKETAP